MCKISHRNPERLLIKQQIILVGYFSPHLVERVRLATVTLRR